MHGNFFIFIRIWFGFSFGSIHLGKKKSQSRRETKAASGRTEKFNHNKGTKETLEAKLY